MYDLLVYIGRFQPFHNGHKSVIDQAFKLSKNVLVLIGSSGCARTPKNPWSYEERSDMILASYPEGTHLYTDAIRDYPYDDGAWAAEVREAIKFTALDVANPDGFHNNGTADLKIGIIGARKDESSYYLDMFPQYDLVELAIDAPLNATDIRQTMFRGPFVPFAFVPWSTIAVLQEMKAEFWGYMANWQAEIDKNTELWANSPYPVKQVTVDAVVRYNDQILLVERGSHPGKGLLALPGGHLNVGERTLAGSLRELLEETGLKLTKNDLLLSGKPKLFIADHPGRSTMGHTVSHCFYFDISWMGKRPDVVGADDAVSAGWINISELDESVMFDDHYHIIKELLK